MWSWLMPHTANLIVYFGFALASGPACAFSYVTGPFSPNMCSGMVEANPAAPTLRKKERRSHESNDMLSPVTSRGKLNPADRPRYMPNTLCHPGHVWQCIRLTTRCLIEFVHQPCVFSVADDTLKP